MTTESTTPTKTTTTRTTKRKTKRNVDLVSSHHDNERDEGPIAAYSTEGSAISELYNNDDKDRIPPFMCYVPKEGETIIYEDINVPAADDY